MRQLIAGNWKMNGLRGPGLALATAVRDGAAGLGCDLLVCPPATLLGLVADAMAGTAIMVGAQDCHVASSGAYTGDLGAPMLADSGARWVIVGHSERRADHAEADPLVRAKAVAAMAAGLLPIVCVGETEQHRMSGNAEVVVASQIDGSIPDGFNGVVAYEPVWAIGSGRVATAEDVVAMHAVIRAQLVGTLGEAGRGVRILYGGSVKPGNAASLLALPEVGGALVGGASLVGCGFPGDRHRGRAGVASGKGATDTDKVELTFAKGALLDDLSGLFSSPDGNTRRAICLHVKGLATRFRRVAEAALPSRPLFRYPASASGWFALRSGRRCRVRPRSG